MVRSALFFCRNERADAHLPRFQGVGLHIIIYCLNLLGSALQVHSAVRTNQYAHFVQTIHLHKQAISGVKWIISLAHVKPRPSKCLPQLRYTIVRRYNDTFDFSHFFQLSNSLLEGSKLRCTVVRLYADAAEETQIVLALVCHCSDLEFIYKDDGFTICIFQCE